MPRERASAWRMHPAYFALVMATGIVSLACELLGLHALAVALFVAEPRVLRRAVDPARRARRSATATRVRADLTNHGRAVGFFTIVAATCVLGSQCLLVGALRRRRARALWIAGIVLWARARLQRLHAADRQGREAPARRGHQRRLARRVVAAQSVAVLGAQLAPRCGAHAPQALVLLRSRCGSAAGCSTSGSSR